MFLQIFLKPQFHPLFLRAGFLNTVEDDSDADELEKHAGELIDFVKELEMGSFYSKRLAELIGKPKYAGAFVIGDPESRYRYLQAQKEHDQEYRMQLRDSQEKVLTLMVELLRFQTW